MCGYTRVHIVYDVFFPLPRHMDSKKYNNNNNKNNKKNNNTKN